MKRSLFIYHTDDNKKKDYLKKKSKEKAVNFAFDIHFIIQEQ